MLKQNDKIEYTAEAYANSETVGKVQDCTVFVPHMIVGERAIVKVNYAKKGVAYADVVELLEQSARRQVPPCPHFGKCGGCGLLHMSYSEQLAFKRNKVVANLSKIGKLTPEVLPCVPSPKIIGYRNKLALPVRGKVGNVQIGMYHKASHNVVNTDSCALCDGWCTALISLFRNFMHAHKIAPYNEQNFTGEVRHLVARYVDGQLLVTVVCNGEPSFNVQLLYARLQAEFHNVGLFVNINTLKNNVILGKTTRYVAGLRYVESSHLGVKFRLRPDSFFQVNDGVKDLIYAKVKELLDLSNTDVLIDCFSGVGILTNVLASERYQTFAVEIESSAVTDANEIAELNNTPRVTNICGDANVELPKLADEHRGKVMSLVVDPPRKGLGEAICNTILRSNFDNVVYISCDSATLARDLAMLSASYTIDYVQPFDMFPNTDQVETVVCLRRNELHGNYDKTC